MSRNGGRRRWPVVCSGLALLLAVPLVVPPARAGLKAPGVLAEALELRWPRPLAPSVERRPAEVGGVAGERYIPARGGPPVLFVPGATTRGLDDARAIRAATALARAGREVFVPDLDLYRERFGRADVDRLVDAGVALADTATDGQVTIVAFSYGGAYALMAAAEDELRDRIAVLATFGAYWDMAGVAQAAATGVSLVDGERIPWPADPRASEVFVEQVLTLTPVELRADLRAALDGAADPAQLPAPLAALHELITHEDPELTAGILERVPDEVRDRLRAISPSTVADRITAPVVVLHDVDDPAVPYGEALRLARALPDARVHTVELFDHVDLGGDRPRLGLARDLTRVWRFARSALGPQEPALGTLGGRGGLRVDPHGDVPPTT
jgi:pimeloyl-ACP methyl ester carboxylesterase